MPYMDPVRLNRLFDWDPYNGFLSSPHNWVVFHPPIYPKCHAFTLPLRGSIPKICFVFFVEGGCFMMLLVVMVMVVVKICEIGELTDVWSIYMYYFFKYIYIILNSLFLKVAVLYIHLEARSETLQFGFELFMSIYHISVSIINSHHLAASQLQLRVWMI